VIPSKARNRSHERFRMTMPTEAASEQQWTAATWTTDFVVRNQHAVPGRIVLDLSLRYQRATSRRHVSIFVHGRPVVRLRREAGLGAASPLRRESSYSAGPA